MLAEPIRQEPLQRQEKRHTTCIVCDAFGKGIVRGQVENTNIRVDSQFDVVRVAEPIKTCKTENVFG